MNNTINQRIKAISDEYCNGNISELARVIGIEQHKLRDVVGSKQVSPGYETLKAIVENSTLNIDGNWLLTGKGDMLKNALQKVSEELTIAAEPAPNYSTLDKKYINVLEENIMLRKELDELRKKIVKTA